MKVYTIIFVLPFLLFGRLYGQSPSEAAIIKFQNELNLEYADKSSSPLTKKDLKKFKGLAFYPIDLKYRVKAQFTRTPESTPFMMPTTSDRQPIYEKYGEAQFEIDGKTFKLSIYQSHSLRQQKAYKDYLFLPFTDETNGNTSYGGGRYIELSIPAGNEIIIDFNKAYNPYCAYNHQYSCPIPPQENHLRIPIKAGVMAFDKH